VANPTERGATSQPCHKFKIKSVSIASHTGTDDGEAGIPFGKVEYARYDPADLGLKSFFVLLSCLLTG